MCSSSTTQEDPNPLTMETDGSTILGKQPNAQASSQGGDGESEKNEPDKTQDDGTDGSEDDREVSSQTHQ